MLFSNKEGILPVRFRVAKASPKHPAVDDRYKSGFYIQSCLLCVILLFIAITFIYPKKENDNAIFIPLDFIVIAEEIPETQASNQPPPPPRMPAVPVESDIEEMLEEVVFDIESLESVQIPDLPELPGRMGSIGRSPRPLYDSFPEYPESERKKGREGVIDLHIRINEQGKVTKVEVIRNTTNSKILEQSAVDVAYKTIYQPALDINNRPIAAWTQRTYTFGK